MRTYVDRQLDLEDEARDEAARVYLENVRAKVESGNEVAIASRRQLLSTSIEPLAQAIDQWKAEWAVCKPQHQNIGYQRVVDFPSDRLAYLTLRSFFHKVTRRERPGVGSVAVSLGSQIEMEACFLHLKHEKPGVWRWLERNGRLDASAYRYRTTALTNAAQWSNLDWEEWPLEVRANLGAQLMGLLEESLGICAKETLVTSLPGHRVRQKHVYALTPKAIEWLQNQDLNAAWARPWLYPMIEEPRPWVSPDSGGYLTRQEMFVKTKNVKWLEEQYYRDIEPVYSAMNAVQRTPFVINEDVRFTAEHAWLNDWRVKGTAELDEIPEPPYPSGAEPDSNEAKLWRVENAKTKAHNSRQRSRRFSLLSTLKQAKRHRSDLLYFPVQLDTRGRMYTMPINLSPQGPDVQRGMLFFGERKKLTSEEQWSWLRRHGANCAGLDKASFEEREAWVESNMDLITAISEDPVSNREWTEMDKPFAFLAFCLDYTDALEKGSSALPVAMDGTCSGLQHYSAMLRDEVGARPVNLIAARRPQDIYSDVAGNLTTLLHQAAGRSGTEASIARQWLASGLVDRTLCKRPTMTTPYGVTPYGILEQTHAYIRGIQLEKGALPFEDESGWEAVKFIAPLIATAISGAAPRALSAMACIREAAEAVSAAGVQAGWVIPATGFSVQQRYVQSRLKRVKTVVNGTALRFSLRQDLGEDKVAKAKAKAASAPNLIHSLDAAHLMLTVNAMEKQAETPVSYAMIHDSFGCHAADAPLLARVLREQFVHLYEDEGLFSNLLVQLMEGLPTSARDALPPPPGIGTLDLRGVLDSAYFFS